MPFKCLSVRWNDWTLTYMKDDIVHAQLGLLLQSSQRLRVLVAQVAVEGKPRTKTDTVIQGREGEHVAPACIAAAVVH